MLMALLNRKRSAGRRPPRRSGRRPPRRLLICALATAPTLAIFSYGVSAVLYAGRIPPGTRAGGIDIGGLTRTAAEAKLRRDLAGLQSRPIKVIAAGRPIAIDAATAGLSLDAAAMVVAARPGFPSPRLLIRGLFGGRDIAPRVRVDEAKLTTTVAAIAERVDRPMREGYIRYSGTTPVAVAPRPGRVIDRTAAAAAIKAAYLSPGRPVTLAPRPAKPTVTPAQLRRFAASTARTAVARPLTLTRGKKTAKLPAQTLAENLQFVADGKGRLKPRFDAADAVRQVEGKLIDAAQAPRDATFKIVKGKPVLVPSRVGEGVDVAKLATAAETIFLAGGSRTVPIATAVTRPHITSAQARRLGISEKISSFTTQHPCCAPRVTNIHRIADIVDGRIVKPGDTFSLNTLVGERDKARGFVEAPMILNGRYVNDVGGGVSQFATTMFNAVFFGGLADVQHTPHMFYISRYPAGRESTVSFPQPDFRWRNDSPYGVLIKTSYTGTSLTVTFWSTKRFDIIAQASDRYDVHSFETAYDNGPKCIPMPGADGFSIDVWRIFRQHGQVVRKQRFHTVYQPEPRLICGKRPGT
ncbi:MAG TPA: VanW family protein [Streptosporangiaceae bacterium]|nr:VanW family protein [Streptosporangiaceae bacterium]